MESLLQMKERHRVERLRAKQPPIGLWLMTVLIFVVGTVLMVTVSLVIERYWFFCYFVVGGIFLSYNTYVVRGRLEELGDKHRIQIASCQKPLVVNEAID